MPSDERHHLIGLDSDRRGLWWLCSCDNVDTVWRGPFGSIEERDESIKAHRRWMKVGPIGPDMKPIHPDWDPIGNPNPEHPASYDGDEAIDDPVTALG